MLFLCVFLVCLVFCCCSFWGGGGASNSNLTDWPPMSLRCRCKLISTPDYIVDNKRSIFFKDQMCQTGENLSPVESFDLK